MYYRSKGRLERILGIDLYNLYNNIPENKVYNAITSFFFSSNVTKTPIRKIKDIIECSYLSKTMFFISFKPDNSELKIKQNIYEVKNADIRNEIVAKIKCLIVRINF